MSDLELIKTKIADTERKLNQAETKVAEAEHAGNETKRVEHKADVTALRALLIQQQETLNLLLKAGSAVAPTSAPSGAEMKAESWQEMAPSGSGGAAPFQGSGFDGLQDMGVTLPRSEMVQWMFDKYAERSSRFIHLGAPAAMGKTSLLQLFRQFCAKQGVTCIYVSMLMKDFTEVLLDKTGIDARTWTLRPDRNGRCVCGDSRRSFIVMLDDAQSLYSDEHLWASLIKCDSESALPRNISFIISATYSLTTEVSPVDFNQLRHRLVRRNFLLSEREVVEFIRMYSAKYIANVAVALLTDPALIALLVQQCQGHIGVLYVSLRTITDEFFHRSQVTVQDVVGFYLSKDMVKCFSRCYKSGVSTLPEEMRKYLARSVGTGPVPVLPEGVEACTLLVRSGVLEEPANGLAQFTSPAASAFINDLIFPRRSVDSIEAITQRGAFELMKAVVRRMSGTTLRQSVVDARRDMPSEATFQHLMLAGLEAETPPACYICPELSKSFPEQAGQAIGVAVTGRCDFYINGGLRWAIEALINGDAVGEHIARLEGGGKYEGLAYVDYVVVDFRVNATGNATNVWRHAHRMSVFFKRGDFSVCTVVCGLAEDSERIPLEN